MSDKPTVMFVDDEDGFLMSMRRMLTRQRDPLQSRPAPLTIGPSAMAAGRATKGK